METWGIEPQSCNRPFVGFGASDANPFPQARMTGIEPVTTCLRNKHSVHLSYILIGSLDGSCTRFFQVENPIDLSARPRGYTGEMGFEPEPKVLETAMLPLHHLCIGRSDGS